MKTSRRDNLILLSGLFFIAGLAVLIHFQTSDNLFSSLAGESSNNSVSSHKQPTITTVGLGSATDGIAVTISGSNFATYNDVWFDGVLTAANVPAYRSRKTDCFTTTDCTTDFAIRFVMPFPDVKCSQGTSACETYGKALLPGTHKVTIMNVHGTSQPSWLVIPHYEAPQLLAVVPDASPVGATVRIVGSNLDPLNNPFQNTILLDDVALRDRPTVIYGCASESCTPNSNQTYFELVIPDISIGKHLVRIRNPGGESNELLLSVSRGQTAD
jgi:hypothetical protein